MKPDIQEQDGNITVSTSFRTKTIRAPDGTIRKMISYDGETWRLAANGDEEMLRLRRASNLRGIAYEEAKKKQFQAVTNPGIPGPAVPPVIEFHEGTMLGKEKGKNQKYRRNLKHKKREPRVHLDSEHKNPSHFHYCIHHQDKFICSCDQPKKTAAKCGGDVCIHATTAEMFLRQSLAH